MKIQWMTFEKIVHKLHHSNEKTTITYYNVKVATFGKESMIGERGWKIIPVCFTYKLKAFLTITMYFLYN